MHIGARDECIKELGLHKRIRSEMNIKIVLGESSQDNRWWGLVEIDGEIYKVTLWIGSAVKPTTALLQTAAWTELTEEGSLFQPIKEAYDQYHHPPEPSHIVTRHSIDQIKNLVVDNPEAADEIAKLLDKYLTTEGQRKEGGE